MNSLFYLSFLLGIASAGVLVRRDTVISVSARDSGLSKSLGSVNQLTTINAGVRYWLSGGITHNIFGNLNNSGQLVLSQTDYLKLNPFAVGLICDWTGTGYANGNLNNAAGALISVNDFGSLAGPSIIWTLHAFNNYGAIQFCGRGDLLGSLGTYQLICDIDCYNYGVIDYEQYNDNLGIDFRWRNNLLDNVIGGYNIYNQGAFRVINVNFHNVQNILGNGCFVIDEGGILYLESGTGLVHNPTNGPAMPNQKIYFTNAASPGQAGSLQTLHLDLGCYLNNPDFGPQIYNYGGNRTIEFSEIIKTSGGFSYDGTAGILRVNFTTNTYVNLKIGIGYNPALFAIALNPQYYNLVGFNAIFYRGTAPVQTIPDICQVSLGRCINPESTAGSLTTTTTRRSTTTVSPITTTSTLATTTSASPSTATITSSISISISTTSPTIPATSIVTSTSVSSATTTTPEIPTTVSSVTTPTVPTSTIPSTTVIITSTITIQTTTTATTISVPPTTIPVSPTTTTSATTIATTTSVVPTTTSSVTTVVVPPTTSLIPTTSATIPVNPTTTIITSTPTTPAPTITTSISTVLTTSISTSISVISTTIGGTTTSVSPTTAGSSPSATATGVCAGGSNPSSIYTDTNGDVYGVCLATEFQGDDLTTFPGVTTPEACANICSQNFACISASLNTDSQSCVLKSIRGPASANPSIDSVYKITPSGIGICAGGNGPSSRYVTPNGDLFGVCTNTEFPSGDISTEVDVASSDDCANVCSTTDGCIAGSVNLATNTCVLKNVRNTPNNVPGTDSVYKISTSNGICAGGAGITSTYTAANGDVYGVCKDTIFPNGDLTTVSSIPDSNSCAEVCSITSGCISASIDLGSGSCTLKNARSPATTADGIDSVFKISSSTTSPSTSTTNSVGPTTSSTTASATLSTIISTTSISGSATSPQTISSTAGTSSNSSGGGGTTPVSPSVTTSTSAPASSSTGGTSSVPGGSSSTQSVTNTGSTSFTISSSQTSGTASSVPGSSTTTGISSQTGVNPSGSSSTNSASGSSVTGSVTATNSPITTGTATTTASTATTTSTSGPCAGGVGPNRTYASSNGDVYWVCVNTDLNGGDITAIPGITTAEQCAEECDRTPGCIAGSLIRNSSLCNLKSAQNLPIPNNNVDSVYKVSSGPVTPSGTTSSGSANPTTTSLCVCSTRSTVTVTATRTP